MFFRERDTCDGTFCNSAQYLRRAVMREKLLRNLIIDRHRDHNNHLGERHQANKYCCFRLCIFRSCFTHHISKTDAHIQRNLRCVHNIQVFFYLADPIHKRITNTTTYNVISTQIHHLIN